MKKVKYKFISLKFNFKLWMNCKKANRKINPLLKKIDRQINKIKDYQLANNNFAPRKKTELENWESFIKRSSEND